MGEIHLVECDVCSAKAPWWTVKWAKISIHEASVAPPQFDIIGDIPRYMCPACLKRVFNYGTGKE